MSVLIKRTGDVHLDGVKIIAYGQAGAGKTSLCKTLPNPLIISAESGLLPLQQADLPYIEIKTMQDLIEAFQWLKESAEASEFQSIAIDSISEIGEVCLAHEMKLTKDPRRAYGEMNQQMAHIIRAFRDLKGKHVYISAKLSQAQDEGGAMLYSPSMPGKTAGAAMPYFFDEVLAVRVEKDGEGNVHRVLQCQPDGRWQAKDRSGKLEMWEKPDLGDVIKKIQGEPF
jgi:phage nucleotide-binding protein